MHVRKCDKLVPILGRKYVFSVENVKTVARYILICAMAIDGHLAIINLGEFGGLDFFQIPKCMHKTAQGNGITNNSIDI